MSGSIRGLATVLAGVLMAMPVVAAPATVADNINLRRGPGVQYPPIAIIPYGDTVEVIGCARTWCEVDWRGARGFASRSYLSYSVSPRGHRRNQAPAVIVPPPYPPQGPVVYSAPHFDAPVVYKSWGAGFFFGY